MSMAGLIPVTPSMAQSVPVGVQHHLHQMAGSLADCVPLQQLCSYRETGSDQHHVVAVEKVAGARSPSSSQFVDLLGYFSVGECVAGNEDKISSYAQCAVDMLRSQNSILFSHANSAIYNSLSQLVDFPGYYLESDPCLVCNNPEVSFTNMKLSSLKVDTKYTTSTQIVKLTGSHSISKILLRIGDLKRQKMVRTNNNRTVQAVVELKNRPTMWHLAKKITLTSGQTDLKIEFPLPIVACNIMIEYSDFYENIQVCYELRIVSCFNYFY